MCERRAGRTRTFRFKAYFQLQFAFYGNLGAPRQERVALHHDRRAGADGDGDHRSLEDRDPLRSYRVQALVGPSRTVKVEPMDQAPAANIRGRIGGMMRWPFGGLGCVPGTGGAAPGLAINRVRPRRCERRQSCNGALSSTTISRNSCMYLPFDILLCLFVCRRFGFVEAAPPLSIQVGAPTWGRTVVARG